MNEINQINISGVDYDIISNSAENKIRELQTKINNIPEGDAVAWKNGSGKIVALDDKSTISIGTNTYIGKGVSIGENVSIPDNWSPSAGSSGESLWTKGNNDSVVCDNIKIGSNVRIGTDAEVDIRGPIRITEQEGIQIGAGIFIGSDVSIQSGFNSRNIVLGDEYGIRVNQSKDEQILINNNIGIVIGTEASPALQIGTSTQIGNDVHIPRGLQFESNDQGLFITDKFKQKRIQVNDEYYDDGSGQLVPIKHPDLSTQPSILPYKFMGQYVYERILPLHFYDPYQRWGFNFRELPFEYSKDVMFIDADFLGTGDYIVKVPVTINYSTATGDFVPVISKELNNTLSNMPNNMKYYIRIVYTSIPEEEREEGGYYGYNNY